MPGPYSSAKNTVGFCDRCGLRYRLSDLRPETVDSRQVDNLVCRECYDEDHPQYKVGRRLLPDPLPVRKPRPDPSLMDSRSLGGFNPTRGNQLIVEIGAVSVA